MIHGAHVILYTRDADADRAFVRDVLRFPHVDVGRGWLIFALPPAEVAMHPADGDPSHELYLMCDDVRAFVADMKSRSIACSRVSEQPWGSLVTVTAPERREARRVPAEARVAEVGRANGEAQGAGETTPEEDSALNRPLCPARAGRAGRRARVASRLSRRIRVARSLNCPHAVPALRAQLGG